MTFYRFCQIVLPIVFKIWLRWEIIGEENIPRKGAAVIAANHISAIDPPAIGSSSSRKMHFMAKAELFRKKWFAAIIRRMGAFPVRRGGADRQAVKTALNLLKSGEIVAVFPEGTRSKTGKLGAANSGAFMFAARTHCDIIPCCIYGSDLKRHSGWPKVIITFGKPLPYDKEAGTSKENLEKISLMWRESMLELQKAVEEKYGNNRS